MTITVEAVYENGTLRLDRPLPLQEQERVEVTVRSFPHSAPESPRDSEADDPIGRSHGLLGWKGTSEQLAYFALDPELDPQESA